MTFKPLYLKSGSKHSQLT